jgi:hypothetical protein
MPWRTLISTSKGDWIEMLIYVQFSSDLCTIYHDLRGFGKWPGGEAVDLLLFDLVLIWEHVPDIIKRAPIVHAT